MVQHVWERAKKSLMLDELIIACDDERVQRVALDFGARVAMTAKGHASGTDRILEVINQLDVKVIVNIQADEPLINPQMVDVLARGVLDYPEVSMATLVVKKTEDCTFLNDPNVVKAVIDRNGYALYFSRAPIPLRAPQSQESVCAYYKHIGMYAYTKDFLFTFKNLPEGALEKWEKLEQLRVLENGYKIKCIETKFETIGVDTPEDLERVKQILCTPEAGS
jgi:3-deoxy-manno-octulosonate cytidylyltransferase (CMP-KDO synthetase)